MSVTAWLRSMSRLCYDCWYLRYMQYVGNLKQIDDILVPQIEEEIAEVDRFLHCVKQYLYLYFEEIKVFLA